ncbi:hypothetical protein FO440_05895 [Mucilaginibacter corticis]|uniref:Uncharacterized protein n=1 Tax=Mucilaginibacter corticis TaxID=2597670 RepID=A0A556MUV3_9SPHI|nr:hypothetical protein [Mucilaginibacter corticis]TSJ43721.1 hypothetical protein FO440_05895 [Mucilaginibacter corticis]
METTDKPDWQFDVKYKQKLETEEAKLIIEGAETAFNDSIETSVRILERTTSLLQLVAGVLVGLVAYAIGDWEKTASFDAILVTAIAGITYYFLLGIFFIYPNIRPMEYVLPGTQPKKVINDTVFDLPKDNRLKLLYITRITNLQAGITENRAKNDKRWKIYKQSLNLLFYSPIVLIVVYLISRRYFL